MRTALLLPVLLALAACGGDPPPAPGGKGGKGDGRPTPVVTSPAETREYAQAITGVATLRAREGVTVTAPASGRVREVLFREGQRVAAGTPLVRLEDDEERAESRAAAANAELQAGRFARIAALRGQGLVSQEDRDAAAQALEEARARAELARVRLDLRTIRAPFAGMLGFRQVSPGALVQPGDAIVTLDALDALRADFPVPESLLALVEAGTPVSGQAAAWPGRAFSGRVTLVGTRVDADTRSATVQALVDNPDGVLRPGMLLTLSLPARPRTALFVPEAALVPENARQFVWLAGADGVAARREVATGVRSAGTVEIVAGLAPGDRVVIEGQGNLREGSAVSEAAAGSTAP